MLKITLFLFSGFLLAFSQQAVAAEEQSNTSLNDIEGVWTKQEDPKNHVPSFENGFYKIIVGGVHRVLWIRDGVLTRMHGVEVNFDGEIMIESPAYSTTNNNLRDRSFIFKVIAVKDTFHQLGIPGSGSFENLEEKWNRIGKDQTDIEGVWTRILDNGNMMQKIIVDNFWQFVLVNPRTNDVVGSLGGTYSIKGEEYVETTLFKMEGLFGDWELGRKWKANYSVKNNKLSLQTHSEDGQSGRTENWSKMDAKSLSQHYAKGGFATFSSFKKWISLFSGTWEGKVASTIAESNLGKNSKPYTVRFTSDIDVDLNILLGQGIGPNGPSHMTTFYDPAAMKIVQLNLGSDGTVSKSLIYPGDNAWLRTSTYTRQNGQKSTLNSTLNFSENNNTMTIQISGEIDGAIVAKQTNVWRRVQ
tara:strand:+ start:989 stop:2233 length:1245 start_codon:yes stop_codon:yes gene_type:complete